MESNKVREAFLEFFRSKQHEIVASAPMVVKNDPTLMFTNAGMNQFKDIFLGNAPRKYPRVADTQKCLRVSGMIDAAITNTKYSKPFPSIANILFAIGSSSSIRGASS